MIISLPCSRISYILFVFAAEPWTCGGIDATPNLTADLLDGSKEIQIVDNATFVPNPPMGKMCPPLGASARQVFIDVLEKLERDVLPRGEAKKTLRRRVREIFDFYKTHPYPPVHRVHGYVYSVCTLKFRIRTLSGHFFRRMMLFAPEDDQDRIGECDVLPWLMDLATAKEPGGVAIDIGAGGSGDCSFPVLSQGHKVYMFESGYEDINSQKFVNMTVNINNWQGMASQHDAVRKKKEMNKILGEEKRIDLLKIDVDDNSSYLMVFRAVEDILPRTEIVQIELISGETPWQDKGQVLRHFDARGFDMYGLEDTHTFPGKAHGSLQEFIDVQLFSDDVDQGAVDYQYGQDGPQNIQMFPICMCEGSTHRGKEGPYVGNSPSQASRLRPLYVGAEFAFVRRGSQTMGRVEPQYGSCKLFCASLQGASPSSRKDDQEL